MSDIKPMESHLDGCEEDIEDLIYLAETYGMVQRDFFLGLDALIPST
jgi:hypothetical protein